MSRLDVLVLHDGLYINIVGILPMPACYCAPRTAPRTRWRCVAITSNRYAFRRAYSPSSSRSAPVELDAASRCCSRSRCCRAESLGPCCSNSASMIAVTRCRLKPPASMPSWKESVFPCRSHHNSLVPRHEETHVGLRVRVVAPPSLGPRSERLEMRRRIALDVFRHDF